MKKLDNERCLTGLGSGQARGGLLYEINGDTRRLAYGGTFWILVSRRVFRAKRQYFKPPRSRLGFREKHRITRRETEVKFSFFFFFKQSLLGVKSHAQIGLL